MNSKIVTYNFIWRFLERSSAQCVAFVVSIYIARILAPEVYGTIALVIVFTTIMQVFVDSGMGNALIQKKDADDTDFSTVFYFNFFVCIVLYAIMFALAPFIADFFNLEELTNVVRVLSLVLVVSGIKNVQQAYVARNMLFKRFFWSTLGGTVSSGIIGIYMAYNGFGVWALVAQNLSNAAIDTLILWIIVKWRPTKQFSFIRLRDLFSYGWKLLVSSLIITIYNDIRQLIVGKLYTASDLAYFNRGNQFPNVIVSNVNTSIDSVLLPIMSKEQDNKETVRAMTQRAVKISTYVMAPLMMGLAFTSKQVVELILTEKWLPCVPYLCIFCIIYLFYPIHTTNLNAVKALGRSDLFLKLEIIKMIVGVIILISTMWFGPLVICASGLVTTFFSQIINAWPNKKLLNYSIIEQWKDIIPAILLATFMGICVWILGYFIHFQIIIVLIIQIIVGAAIYIAGSVLFKIDSFFYILTIIKSFKTK